MKNFLFLVAVASLLSSTLFAQDSIKAKSKEFLLEEKMLERRYHSPGNFGKVVPGISPLRNGNPWTQNIEYEVGNQEMDIQDANGLSTEQFTEQTSISLVGIKSGSVAWGDYDNDGDLDILLTGGSSSNDPVSKIYKNNGNGTFSEQTSISLANVSSSSVAWGDYDNDGNLDILLTGQNSSNIPVSKIYKNNGNGTFSEQVSILLAGVCYSSVAWGDYDNDADLDILLTGQNSSNIPVSKIYKNNGNGTFDEQASTNLIGVKFSSVAWGDYDNDGFLDFLMTGVDQSYNGVTKIYKNLGDGTFADQSSLGIAILGYGSVAWGDYNNDGFLDILLTGQDQSYNDVTKIYKNLGDGTFIDLVSVAISGFSYGSTAWGDYDNDGDLDILVTGYYSNTVYRDSRIYENNGDGTFSEQTAIFLLQVSRSSVAWGDYDNDGDLDILLTGVYNPAHLNNSHSIIYKNNNSIFNTIPSSPTNLTTTVNENSVTFSWDKSTDNETPQNGLHYNLVIGTTSNSFNSLSPMADRSTGYRRVVRLGNAQTNSWTIKDLPAGTYYWSVQAIDAAFAGSQFATEQSFTLNAPLPVELTTFTGKVFGGQIVLNWETKTEIDNYGFEIEMRTDNSGWIKTGFVEGAGTSNSPRYYRYEERNKYSGSIWYRLKQIDNSGDYDYSDSILVQIGLPNVYKLYQNYPNPFNPITYIDFDLPVAGFTTLTVYDISGSKRKTIINSVLDRGKHTISLDASDLSSGVYFYQLQSHEFKATKKLVVMK